MARGRVVRDGDVEGKAVVMARMGKRGRRTLVEKCIFE